MKISEYRKDFYINKAFGLFYIANNGKNVTKGYYTIEKAIQEFEGNQQLVKPVRVENKSNKRIMDMPQPRDVVEKNLLEIATLTEKKPTKKKK